MAYAMTKRGSLDNCITYEFMCDTISDMNAIENRYRTIGSVAIVLSGEDDGLEVYISGSDKQWHAMGAGIGASSGGTSIIPTPPVSNGEYLLKLTVANGTSTYAWLPVVPSNAVTMADGTVITDENGEIIGVDEPTT